MAEVRGTLEGRLVELGQTIGYLLVADNGEKKMTSKLPIFKITQLIEKGAKVEGAEVYDGQLIVNSDLYRRLPVVKSKYMIAETIKDSSDKAIGYELKGIDNSNDSHRVDIKTAWKLAVDGSIENVEAHVIRGSNCST